MSQITNKSLLVFTPGFPENEQDTTCLPAVQQFILCYKKTFPEKNIIVVSFQYPYNRRSYLWNGIKIYSLGGKNSGGARKFLTIYRALKISLLINRKHKPGKILSLWLTETAFAGNIVSKLLKIPHITWMHGQDAKAGNKYFGLIKPKPEQIAAISDSQNDVFEKAYGIRAGHVLYNGLNTDIFPAFNIRDRVIDIFAAGNLIELKRYHFLIEVVKYLKEEGLDYIKAEIAGEGPQREELSNLIEENNLKENIVLLGKISHKEILDKMNNSRMFMHTSLYEGHSTVILEALYSGCIVLSTIPISREIVENFIFCDSLNALKLNCNTTLNGTLSHKRILVNDMVSTVKQTEYIFSTIKY